MKDEGGRRKEQPGCTAATLLISAVYCAVGKTAGQTLAVVSLFGWMKKLITLRSNSWYLKPNFCSGKRLKVLRFGVETGTD